MRPPIICIDIAQPDIAHRLHRANWRHRHQDIERLLLALGGVSHLSLRIHPVEGKTTLMANISRRENRG